MRDVIYIKLDIVYPINQQLNETISRKFSETVKSKVIISFFYVFAALEFHIRRNKELHVSERKKKQD